MNRHLLCLLLLLCPLPGLAATPAEAEARALFHSGKYQAALEKIDEALAEPAVPPGRKGFLYYWKGVSAARLQDFAVAIESFQSALAHAYRPADLPYELGQAYFGSSQLPKAKVQFMDSVREKYKASTSLYYIGFIAKELDQRDDARLAWTTARTVNDAEAAETHQASALQLADLEREVIVEGSDVFRKIEREVIPRYEAVASMKPASPLATEARKKIVALQKDYNLVLFQLRNGRPTLIPPYLLRGALETGFDTNVTFNPQETTVAEARQGSAFSRAEAFGRYTLYVKDFISSRWSSGPT
jgi:tetratricopeptide (TPR) repeat protein